MCALDSDLHAGSRVPKLWTRCGSCKNCYCSVVVGLPSGLAAVWLMLGALSGASCHGLAVCVSPATVSAWQAIWLQGLETRVAMPHLNDRPLHCIQVLGDFYESAMREDAQKGQW